MQNTIFYVAANETLGVVKDYANARTAAAPTLVRAVAARIKIRRGRINSFERDLEVHLAFVICSISVYIMLPRVCGLT